MHASEMPLRRHASCLATPAHLLGMTMSESPFFTTPASLLPITTVPMSLRGASTQQVLSLLTWLWRTGTGRCWQGAHHQQPVHKTGLKPPAHTSRSDSAHPPTSCPSPAPRVHL